MRKGSINNRLKAKCTVQTVSIFSQWCNTETKHDFVIHSLVLHKLCTESIYFQFPHVSWLTE